MNRDNVLAALDDEGVQALATQCHSAMKEYAATISAQDLIVAAVAVTENDGDCAIADVEAHITMRLAQFVLSYRELHEIRNAYTQFMAGDEIEMGEVRASPRNFQ